MAVTKKGTPIFQKVRREYNTIPVGIGYSREYNILNLHQQYFHLI